MKSMVYSTIDDTIVWSIAIIYLAKDIYGSDV